MASGRRDQSPERRHAAVTPCPGGRTPAPRSSPVSAPDSLLDRLPAILYIADAGAEGRWHYVSAGIEQATAIVGLGTGAVPERTAPNRTLELRAGVGLGASGELDWDAGELPRGIVGHIEGRDRRWGELWLGGSCERTLGAADSDF